MGDDSPIGSEQDHYGLSKGQGYATMYNSNPKRAGGPDARLGAYQAVDDK